MTTFSNSSRARPRRSAIYMPASNLRALAKAKTLSADVLIFDLEDAVATDVKESARAAAVAAAKSGAYGSRDILIRVNGLDTEWFADDISAVAASGADGVVLPKVNSASDVQSTDQKLRAVGAPDELILWAMMETPKGILAAADIAASSRLAGMIIGTADLAKDLHCAHPLDRGPMILSLQTCILAARANGLWVLDGVHIDLEDDRGFEAVCRQGKELGFDGKTLIHPKQIAIANEVNAPSAEDVDRARHLINQHRKAIAAGKGITVVDGRLVESLHVHEAEQLIASAMAIEELERDAADVQK